MLREWIEWIRFRSKQSLGQGFLCTCYIRGCSRVNPEAKLGRQIGQEESLGQGMGAAEV